jgi:hypothetical protein
LAVAWVTADGVAPRGAQPTSVDKRFAASTTWGYPHPSTHRTRAGGPGVRGQDPRDCLISQRTLRLGVTAEDRAR